MKYYELIEHLGWKNHKISQDLVTHWIPNSHDTQDIYLFEGGRVDDEWLEIVYADNYEQALNFWYAQVEQSAYPIFNYKTVENLRVILESLIFNKSTAEFIEIDPTLKEMGWKCAYFNESTAHWIPDAILTEHCYLLESGKPGNQTICLIYANDYEHAQEVWHKAAADSCEPVFHYASIENLKTILICGI